MVAHITPTALFWPLTLTSKWIYIYLISSFFKTSVINRCVTLMCVFLCVAWLFFSPHPPLPLSLLYILVLPLLFLLRFDFATHRNFRKHLRMVGSRRLKAQSESDVCGWYVCSNWLWCSSPRHHKCFVFLFILACSRLCVCHQALLLLCWDFFLNQHIVSLWRLYIDQCVFDKSAIWLCMCIYVCVSLCTVCAF